MPEQRPSGLVHNPVTHLSIPLAARCTAQLTALSCSRHPSLAALQILGRAFTIAVVLLNATWNLPHPSSQPEPSQQGPAAPPPSAAALGLAPPSSQAASGGPKTPPEDSRRGSEPGQGVDRGVEAAQHLDALAWLQFCRLRLGLYSRLLQGLLAALMDGPSVSWCLIDLLHMYAAGLETRSCWRCAIKRISGSLEACDWLQTWRM